MISKLEAARSAALSGAATILCNGKDPNILGRILEGEAVGTLFLPGERISSRKHWLAFTARTHGSLVLDSGAAHALEKQGASLLPAGITDVQGDFGIGDPVLCIAENGRELARGLPAYSAEEIRRIKQTPASQISTVLGYSNGDELIHRDNLVILSS